MNEIEKRARELLAAHLVETKALWGPPLTDQTFDLGLMPPTMQACVRAIIAALTPPEGFVLVPVEPTEAMLDAEYATAEIHDEYGEDRYVENAEAVWAAMLAARPEVQR